MVALAPSRQRPRTAQLAQCLFAALLAVAAVAAVALVFTGIATFPAVGNDEWWFTSQYDRGTMYGDWSDTVAFDRFLNNRERPKFPPANALLRMVAHRLTSIGAPLDRYLSALEVVVVGLLLSYVARQLGASMPAAILSVPLLLLNPVVFFVARSFRFEQDIFFFGGVSVLLACLPSTGRPRDAARLALSGFMAGMAATMHLFGLAYGGAVIGSWAASWLLGRAGPPAGHLARWWLVACAVPVVATTAYFAADWQNTSAYYEANARFEAAHLSMRLDNLAAAYPPLVPGLPERLHVTINALRVAIQPYGGTPLAGAASDVLAALWGIGFLLVMMGVPSWFWTTRTCRSGNVKALSMALLTCWAATFLTAAITVLRPHADYAVYFYGLTGMTLLLLVAALRIGRTSAPLWSRAGYRVGCTVLLAMMALGAGYVGPLVADPTRHLGGSVEVQTRGMRLVSTMAGLEPSANDRPPIYADTVSWAAGGARFVPLYEYLISEVADRRDRYDAVVFKYEWYQTFVGRIATFTGEPIDSDRRRERMVRLLDDLAFAGALQQDYGAGRRPEARLWFAREVPGGTASLPSFARIGADGRLSAARGELAVDAVATSDTLGTPIAVPAALRPGAYFVMATSVGPEFARVALTVDGTQQAISVPSISLPQEQVGAVLWLTVNSSQGNTSLTVDTNGLRGTVRVRAWHVPWKPADGQELSTAR